MYPIPHEPESILKRSTPARRRVLRVALPVLMSLVLAACGARNTTYQGTCAQQTQQFMDYVHALVVDELNPVIEEGVQSGDNAETIQKISARYLGSAACWKRILILGHDKRYQEIRDPRRLKAGDKLRLP